eukprot:gnl/Chilomastix_cuspidata/98.p1 GENE.gnl/Chilomastix_cuspidata/98~~gnl/Chilomastix_cuspidata/98.p1  ORF type:complete len:2832 (-),score=715.05 gnl/Chilomastix_cuspidata/98:3889-12384(-)
MDPPRLSLMRLHIGGLPHDASLLFHLPNSVSSPRDSILPEAPSRATKELLKTLHFFSAAQRGCILVDAQRFGDVWTEPNPRFLFKKYIKYRKYRITDLLAKDLRPVTSTKCAYSALLFPTEAELPDRLRAPFQAVLACAVGACRAAAQEHPSGARAKGIAACLAPITRRKHTELEFLLNTRARAVGTTPGALVFVAHLYSQAAGRPDAWYEPLASAVNAYALLHPYDKITRMLHTLDQDLFGEYASQALGDKSTKTFFSNHFVSFVSLLYSCVPGAVRAALPLPPLHTHLRHVPPCPVPYVQLYLRGRPSHFKIFLAQAPTQAGVQVPEAYYSLLWHLFQDSAACGAACEGLSSRAALHPRSVVVQMRTWYAFGRRFWGAPRRAASPRAMMAHVRNFFATFWEQLFAKTYNWNIFTRFGVLGPVRFYAALGMLHAAPDAYRASVADLDVQVPLKRGGVIEKYFAIFRDTVIISAFRKVLIRLGAQGTRPFKWLLTMATDILDMCDSECLLRQYYEELRTRPIPEVFGAIFSRSLDVCYIEVSKSLSLAVKTLRGYIRGCTSFQEAQNFIKRVHDSDEHVRHFCISIRLDYRNLFASFNEPLQVLADPDKFYDILQNWNLTKHIPFDTPLFAKCIESVLACRAAPRSPATALVWYPFVHPLTLAQISPTSPRLHTSPGWARWFYRMSATPRRRHPLTPLLHNAAKPAEAYGDLSRVAFEMILENISGSISDRKALQMFFGNVWLSTSGAAQTLRTLWQAREVDMCAVLLASIIVYPCAIVMEMPHLVSDGDVSYLMRKIHYFFMQKSTRYASPLVSSETPNSTRAARAPVALWQEPRIFTTMSSLGNFDTLLLLANCVFQSMSWASAAVVFGALAPFITRINCEFASDAVLYVSPNQLSVSAELLALFAEAKFRVVLLISPYHLLQLRLSPLQRVAVRRAGPVSAGLCALFRSARDALDACLRGVSPPQARVALDFAAPPLAVQGRKHIGFLMKKYKQNAQSVREILPNYISLPKEASEEYCTSALLLDFPEFQSFEKAVHPPGELASLQVALCVQMAKLLRLHAPRMPELRALFQPARPPSNRSLKRPLFYLFQLGVPGRDLEKAIARACFETVVAPHGRSAAAYEEFSLVFESLLSDRGDKCLTFLEFLRRFCFGVPAHSRPEEWREGVAAWCAWDNLPVLDAFPPTLVQKLLIARRFVYSEEVPNGPASPGQDNADERLPLDEELCFEAFGGFNKFFFLTAATHFIAFRRTGSDAAFAAFVQNMRAFAYNTFLARDRAPWDGFLDPMLRSFLQPDERACDGALPTWAGSLTRAHVVRLLRALLTPAARCNGGSLVALEGMKVVLKKGQREAFRRLNARPPFNGFVPLWRTVLRCAPSVGLADFAEVFVYCPLDLFIHALVDRGVARHGAPGAGRAWAGALQLQDEPRLRETEEAIAAHRIADSDANVHVYDDNQERLCLACAALLATSAYLHPAERAALVIQNENGVKKKLSGMNKIFFFFMACSIYKSARIRVRSSLEDAIAMFEFADREWVVEKAGRPVLAAGRLFGQYINPWTAVDYFIEGLPPNRAHDVFKQLKARTHDPPGSRLFSRAYYVLRAPKYCSVDTLLFCGAFPTVTGSSIFDLETLEKVPIQGIRDPRLNTLLSEKAVEMISMRVSPCGASAFCGYLHRYLQHRWAETPNTIARELVFELIAELMGFGSFQQRGDLLGAGVLAVPAASGPDTALCSDAFPLSELLAAVLTRREYASQLAAAVARLVRRKPAPVGKVSMSSLETFLQLFVVHSRFQFQITDGLRFLDAPSADGAVREMWAAAVRTEARRTLLNEGFRLLLEEIAELYPSCYASFFEPRLLESMVANPRCLTFFPLCCRNRAAFAERMQPLFGSASAGDPSTGDSFFPRLLMAFPDALFSTLEVTGLQADLCRALVDLPDDVCSALLGRLPFPTCRSLTAVLGALDAEELSAAKRDRLLHDMWHRFDWRLADPSTRARLNASRDLLVAKIGRAEFEERKKSLQRLIAFSDTDAFRAMAQRGVFIGSGARGLLRPEAHPGLLPRFAENFQRELHMYERYAELQRGLEALVTEFWMLRAFFYTAVTEGFLPMRMQASAECSTCSQAVYGVPTEKEFRETCAEFRRLVHARATSGRDEFVELFAIHAKSLKNSDVIFSANKKLRVKLPHLRAVVLSTRASRGGLRTYKGGLQLVVPLDGALDVMHWVPDARARLIQHTYFYRRKAVRRALVEQSLYFTAVVRASSPRKYWRCPDIVTARLLGRDFPQWTSGGRAGESARNYRLSVANDSARVGMAGWGAGEFLDVSSFRRKLFSINTYFVESACWSRDTFSRNAAANARCPQMPLVLILNARVAACAARTVPRGVGADKRFNYHVTTGLAPEDRIADYGGDLARALRSVRSAIVPNVKIEQNFEKFQGFSEFVVHFMQFRPQAIAHSRGRGAPRDDNYGRRYRLCRRMTAVSTELRERIGARPLCDPCGPAYVLPRDAELTDELETLVGFAGRFFAFALNHGVPLGAFPLHLSVWHFVFAVGFDIARFRPCTSGAATGGAFATYELGVFMDEESASEALRNLHAAAAAREPDAFETLRKGFRAAEAALLAEPTGRGAKADPMLHFKRLITADLWTQRSRALGVFAFEFLRCASASAVRKAEAAWRGCTVIDAEYRYRAHYHALCRAAVVRDVLRGAPITTEHLLRHVARTEDTCTFFELVGEASGEPRDPGDSTPASPRAAAYRRYRSIYNARPTGKDVGFLQALFTAWVGLPTLPHPAVGRRGGRFKVSVSFEAKVRISPAKLSLPNALLWTTSLLKEALQHAIRAHAEKN